MRKIKLPSIIFSCLTILLTTNICNAQNLIAVQNGTNHSFYTTLDSAITQSQNGDTIYIPGGAFSISSPLNKSIHIVGIGHNPDSSQATNITLLVGDINIFEGANNGSVTGIKLSGLINIETNQVIHDFIIERCNFSGLYFKFNTPNQFNNSSNILIKENIINGIVYGGYSHNNLVTNNIIQGQIYAWGANNAFRNNISMQAGPCCGGYPLVNVASCQFENNIFLQTFFNVFSENCQTNTFNNNLFVSGLPYDPSSIFNNSYHSQPHNSIFVSQSGYTFNYTNNYQLQATSVGKNGGTDGTDVGIYGGSSPWKEGSIPFNPHIQLKNISGSTTPNGNLQINIKVAAQNN